MLQKIVYVHVKAIIAGLAVVLAIFSLSAVASAVSSATCPDGTLVTSPDNRPASDFCPSIDRNLNPAGNCDAKNGDCISADIQLAVDILAAGIGVVVTAMIIIGGMQYMTSRDNPQAVQAAKSKILNAVIALVALIFVWAFLQWIVPGGLFH